MEAGETDGRGLTFLGLVGEEPEDEAEEEADKAWGLGTAWLMSGSIYSGGLAPRFLLMRKHY